MAGDRPAPGLLCKGGANINGIQVLIMSFAKSSHISYCSQQSHICQEHRSTPYIWIGWKVR